MDVSVSIPRKLFILWTHILSLISFYRILQVHNRDLMSGSQ